MDNKGKWKSITVSDKMNILVEIDAHIGTCVELASRVETSMFTLDTIVKNHEKIEKNYVQCGPFPKLCKSLKCLPLEVLESVLAARFKQAHESNASVDGNHLKEKACTLLLIGE
jgi:hypothetical protein